MDEFVEQFLIESRELIEQASAALDALARGGNAEREIDSLFRAIHTLKGAAGIVDFAAMGRALHGVEELLSKLRTSRDPVPRTLVPDCYGCIDQVTRWLDHMQTTGEPPKDAEAAADAIVSRFAHPATAVAAEPTEVGQAWLQRLSSDHPEAVREGVCAFLYRPAEDAFFKGEDPLALVATVPGLLALDLSLANDLGLDDLDPFDCSLRIAGLSHASPGDVERVFGEVPDQIEIVALGQGSAAGGALSSAARALLEAQALMLELGAADGREGRIRSAGHVALNVLRFADLPEAVAIVEDALGDGRGGDRLQALIEAIRSVLQPPVTARAIVDEQVQAPAAARSLRVDMNRIDALVNLTGELIVVKNAIGHIAGMSYAAGGARSIGPELRKQRDLFERLVQQLQRAVLEVRVLPLRHVFQRFPRLVRETSSTLGKPVTFMIEGEATEADATVVEALFEPLLHILRNAIGHGVEDQQSRAAAGKPPTATISLRAHRRLEHVIVEVEDDGRGIDVERVRQTAVTRQIVSAVDAAGMSETAVVDLIFAPGFSTATEVTGLSGRGVGMDSVKTAVERVGGTVDVETRTGRGTAIRLVLPFSVMMTRVMTVEVSGQIFGLPLDSVVETASVARDAIKAVGAGRALVLRDRTLPVLDLSIELDLPMRDTSPEDAKMVVIASGDQLGALEVERLGDRMDVMLKPMEGLLQGMAGVAGTTLLGDGRVLLVLDVQGLFS